MQRDRSDPNDTTMIPDDDYRKYLRTLTARLETHFGRILVHSDYGFYAKTDIMDIIEDAYWNGHAAGAKETLNQWGDVQREGMAGVLSALADKCRDSDQ